MFWASPLNVRESNRFHYFEGHMAITAWFNAKTQRRQDAKLSLRPGVNALISVARP